MCSYRPWHPKIRLLSYVLMLLTVPCTAQAGLYEDDLDFTLVVASSKTRWLYNNIERETRINSITAIWLQALSDSIRGGLRIAYLDVSQASHPHAVGLNTTGNALGIELQTRLVDTSLLQLSLRFAYDYASTRDSMDDQKIETEWYTTTAGIDVIIAPRNNINLLAGSSLVSVDGEEQLTGTVNEITAFEEHEPLGYYAGLSIKTDKSGSIGLRWHGGHSRGLFLNFSRHF